MNSLGLTSKQPSKSRWQGSNLTYFFTLEIKNIFKYIGIYGNYLNIKGLVNFVYAFIESKTYAGKGWRVRCWEEKVRIVDVDIVTQLLVELDLDAVFQRVCAGGVGVVKSMTDSKNSSSILHIPCFVFRTKSWPQSAFEAKISFWTVKFPANTVKQIIKVRFGTLPLEDFIGPILRSSPVYPCSSFGIIPENDVHSSMTQFKGFCRFVSTHFPYLRNFVLLPVSRTF